MPALLCRALRVSVVVGVALADQGGLRGGADVGEVQKESAEHKEEVVSAGEVGEVQTERLIPASVNATNITAQATLQWGKYPVNLCLPPHGYASIAALGWADGFTGEGYTIENILGSSGGAASGLLILADPNLKSDLGKRVYQQAKSVFETSWTESDAYPYWARVYEKLLKADSQAFGRVSRGSKVALKCWDKGGTAHWVVLYNFRSPRQAAQAHAAAGDPACHASDCPVDGVWGYTASCADSGGSQVDAGFKTGQAAGSKIYYYNTLYLIFEGYLSLGYISKLIEKGRSDYSGWAHSSNYGPAKSDTGYAWIDMR